VAVLRATKPHIQLTLKLKSLVVIGFKEIYSFIFKVCESNRIKVSDSDEFQFCDKVH